MTIGSDNRSFTITGLVLMVLAANQFVQEGNRLLAQPAAPTYTAAASDSVDEASWSDETYYRINLIRLKRYITENREAVADPVLSQEITSLLKEAGVFVQDGDYYLANVWLETIWGLLLPEQQDEIFDLEGGSASEGGITPPRITYVSPKFELTKKVMTGADLWRQSFNLTLFDRDSTILEGNGNPFTGIRLDADYQIGRRAQLQGAGFFKYSRDYLSGEASLRYEGYAAAHSRLLLENRFEGTSFYNDFDLKYWQNQSALAFEQGFGAFALEIDDEFRIRRYATVDSTYPNYFQNSVGGAARLNLSLGSYLSLGYHNLQRWHPDFDVNDYGEHQIRASWSQALGELSSLSLENEVRVRDYKNVTREHFFQDFWETYFVGDLTVGVTDAIGTRVSGVFSKRDYQFHSATSLPDDSYWQVEPELFFNIGEKWKLGAGWHYGEQRHESASAADSPVSADAASVASITFEDYREYGPIITIDFFELNGILFSLRQSFLLRRYPNTPTQNVDQFNLYTDRNSNSVLLFLTWPITSRWELNVLANLDDDRSQKDSSGDSQNTLLDVEISYSF